MNGYEEFKQKVYNLTKLDLNFYKEKQMRRRIESLIGRKKISSYNEYYDLVSNDQAAFDEFINFLTINVSEFYRNIKQWRVLKESVIPELLEGKKDLKIWSAACSTGEEPYSLVMLMSRFMPLAKIQVFACDFDAGAIAKAKMGVYTEKSIQNVPPDFQQKFFERMDRGLVSISDDVKSRVTFKKMNLLRDSYPKGYDLILCRNVMIYFTDEAKHKMYADFHDSLRAGGYLLVGSTEQIIQPSKYGFGTDKTFFYKRMT